MSISNKPPKKLTGNKHLVFSENKSIITIKHPDLPEFRLVKVEGGKGIIKKLNKKTKIADFFMSEYQVTQELYQAVTGNNPSRFKGKRRPVERVNWYDSVRFCKVLNEKLDLPQPVKGNDDGAELDIKKTGFRLPTEAEWEYAANGGKMDTLQTKIKKQYAGSNHLHQVGWYEDNDHFETRPVGLKFPNQLGLYDMSGNVWEWCWDRYDNENDFRVIRGGSWRSNTVNSRVSYRNSAPIGEWFNCGFRLVLSFR